MLHNQKEKDIRFTNKLGKISEIELIQIIQRLSIGCYTYFFYGVLLLFFFIKSGMIKYNEIEFK